MFGVLGHLVKGQGNISGGCYYIVIQISMSFRGCLETLPFNIVFSLSLNRYVNIYIYILYIH